MDHLQFNRPFFAAWLRPTAIAAALLFAAGAASAEPLVFHASAAGKQTLDQGAGGGNPFASALVEILARPSTTLNELAIDLRQLTITKSQGFQSPDVPDVAKLGSWPLLPSGASERRRALVLVVSDYSGGAQSLPGAKQDGERIGAALIRAGFKTEIALDLDLPGIRRRLGDFAALTKDDDAAVVYTTGHGVEVGGRVFLIPGAYPIQEGNSGLAKHAIALSEIGSFLRAKRINLLFYGGCRDNPFGK